MIVSWKEDTDNSKKENAPKLDAAAHRISPNPVCSRNHQNDLLPRIPLTRQMQTSTAQEILHAVQQIGLSRAIASWDVEGEVSTQNFSLKGLLKGFLCSNTRERHKQLEVCELQINFGWASGPL